jgi:hypothetical protein
VCLLLVLGIAGCAQVKVNTLPAPSPTAKLRVFFLPVSDNLPGRQYWAVPHSEYSRNMAMPLIRYLRATGIYTMVPQRDVKTVLGGQDPERILWQSNDWEAAKTVGRALHADYVVITRRGFQGFYFFQTLWINLETGKIFESKDHPGTFLMGTGRHRDEFRKIVRQTYREIFQQAKADLLATAIRKGRILEKGAPPERPGREPSGPAVTPAPKPPPVPPYPPPVVTKAPESPAPEPPATVAKAQPQPPVEEAAPAEPEEAEEKPVSAPVASTKEPSVPAPEKPPPPVPEQPAAPPVSRPAAREPLPMLETAPAGGKTRLVVYDLETSQPMQVAGLILTEALREEIYKLGSYDLVNREDLTKAMEELKLQQSGLVQDKDAVKMGHWLAARQSVTGRLGSLGGTTVLSTKRTDIETLGTIAIGSLKAPAGREEDLLNGLPELARKLTQKQ